MKLQCILHKNMIKIILTIWFDTPICINYLFFVWIGCEEREIKKMEKKEVEILTMAHSLRRFAFCNQAPRLLCKCPCRCRSFYSYTIFCLFFSYLGWTLPGLHFFWMRGLHTTAVKMRSDGGLKHETSAVQVQNSGNNKIGLERAPTKTRLVLVRDKFTLFVFLLSFCLLSLCFALRLTATLGATGALQFRLWQVGICLFSDP